MNNVAPVPSLSIAARMPQPSSEATMVEQSRAVAQVQGALVVARSHPRDELRAGERMREACQVEGLAEHAFFRFSRGGGQVSGASVHLARELARCWGNIDYGINELRRDMNRGESEMMAYAWDLETNAKVTNSFIVPHMRDKRGGPDALTDMRDIYENNANMGARRLRECIFAVLPKSFTEEAKTICGQTLENGGGEPLDQRRAKLLEAFTAIGVHRQQIEKKIGRPADRLSAYDIGVLRVVYGSIKRGETTIGDEFPQDAAAEVTAKLQAAKPAAPTVAPEPPKPAEPAAPPAAPSEPAMVAETPQPKPQWPLVNVANQIIGNYPDSITWAKAYDRAESELDEPHRKAFAMGNSATVERLKVEGAPEALALLGIATSKKAAKK